MLFNRARPAVLCLFFSLIIRPAWGQPGQGNGGGKQTGGQANAGGGNAPALAGFSWVQSDWPQALVLPPTKERAVLCYALRTTNSASQPFVLQPARHLRLSCDDYKNGAKFDDPIAAKQCVSTPADNRWDVCTPLDEEHPLLMRQLLVVALDARDVNTQQLKLLNINVVNQQGVPINPTPLRTSFSASSAIAGSLGDGIYFLTWPNRLPPDNVPTLSVNAVFTPTPSGARWTGETVYSAGSVVTPHMQTGHYYVTPTGGVSGDLEPGFPSGTATITDGSVHWLDSGVAIPGGAGGRPAPTISEWRAGEAHSVGDVVLDPDSGHFFSALLAGASGTNKPTWLNATPITERARVRTFSDSGVIWQETAPAIGKGTATWSPHTPYSQGDVIMNSDGHLYRSSRVGSGLSADAPPTFPIHGQVTDGTVIWEDAGGSAPWTPNTPFSAEYVVTDPQNGGHFFMSLAAGSSGPTRPEFKTDRQQTQDGTVTWQDLGPGSWTAKTQYPMGYAIQDNGVGGRGGSGLFYSARVPGSSGTVRPEFSATSHGRIVWFDAGTAVPSSVSLGQSVDQVVSLLNVTLPQVHSLSYYNLATGLIVSTIRGRTFGFTPAPSFTPVQIGSSPIVDPVLLLTIYPYPMDFESRYHWTNLIPGVSLGLSLSAPSSNYYLGGSSEIWRNLQLTYGISVAKVSKLPASSAYNLMGQGGNPTTANPTTTVGIEKGAFMGVTFNISGFIQTLFGAAGGGGGTGGNGGKSGAAGQ